MQRALLRAGMLQQPPPAAFQRVFSLPEVQGLFWSACELGHFLFLVLPPGCLFSSPWVQSKASTVQPPFLLRFIQLHVGSNEL